MQKITDSFSSIRELFSALNREHSLLTEMFEKRHITYKREYAFEHTDHNEERIDLLIAKGVIQENGNFLEIDARFLDFFEDVLEVNEDINTASVLSEIKSIKENIEYYLLESTATRKYSFLKKVKSSLRKVNRSLMRTVIDLKRNIDNTFKTEPNYKIKIKKLENLDVTRFETVQLMDNIEKLFDADEKAFFASAIDEELIQIITELKFSVRDCRHYSIEMQKQIIEYLNKIQQQSRFLEKIRKVKYLKDQFQLKTESDLETILESENALIFESTQRNSLKLSLDDLETDENHDLIEKIAKSKKSKVTLQKAKASKISKTLLDTTEESEIVLNVHAIKNNFIASGGELYSFLQQYDYPKKVDNHELVTLFCKITSMFENELIVTDDFKTDNGVEYAVVYGK